MENLVAAKTTLSQDIAMAYVLQATSAQINRKYVTFNVLPLHLQPHLKTRASTCTYFHFRSEIWRTVRFSARFSLRVRHMHLGMIPYSAFDSD